MVSHLALGLLTVQWRGSLSSSKKSKISTIARYFPRTKFSYICLIGHFHCEYDRHIPASFSYLPFPYIFVFIYTYFHSSCTRQHFYSDIYIQSTLSPISKIITNYKFTIAIYTHIFPSSHKHTNHTPIHTHI